MKHTTIWKSYGMYSSRELEDYEKQARLNLLNNEFTEEEITEERVSQDIYDDIDMSFEDEQCNLSRVIDGRIIAIADMGLWYGRRSGYKILGNNLNEVLTCGIGCDEKEIYCDSYNVLARGYHHDGYNTVEFRELKENTNYDVLLEKLYNNE